MLDLFMLGVYILFFTLSFLDAFQSKEEPLIDKEGNYLVKYKVSKVESLEPAKDIPKKKRPKKEKEKKVEPHIDADFLDECVFALSSLGFGKRDAKKAAYEILSEGKIGTVEDFLREVFKRK